MQKKQHCWSVDNLRSQCTINGHVIIYNNKEEEDRKTTKEFIAN